MYELVILSLGSNLGDREENLASAITLLGTFNEISNIKGASFYEVHLKLFRKPSIFTVFAGFFTVAFGALICTASRKSDTN